MVQSDTLGAIKVTFQARNREFLVLKLSGQVRSTHNQDGAVVLDIRQGQMFRLNLVGSRILDLLKQGYSETQIAEQVSREFGAPREIVEADLREFFAHLEKNHLLEFAHSETNARGDEQRS